VASAYEELRADLIKQRDLLWDLLQGASPRDAAALASELRATRREIAELPDAEAPADSVETAQEDVAAVLRLVQ
jgi:hypothetical protein